MGKIALSKKKLINILIIVISYMLGTLFYYYRFESDFVSRVNFNQQFQYSDS